MRIILVLLVAASISCAKIYKEPQNPLNYRLADNCIELTPDLIGASIRDFSVGMKSSKGTLVWHSSKIGRGFFQLPACVNLEVASDDADAVMIRYRLPPGYYYVRFGLGHSSIYHDLIVRERPVSE